MSTREGALARAATFFDDGGFKSLQQTLRHRYRLITLRHANRRHANNIARL